MTIRITLPDHDDLADDCLSLPGPIGFGYDGDLNHEVWIAPSDADLVRRRYDMTDDIARARSIGQFADADGLFFKASDEESRVFHSCPWGAGIRSSGDEDVDLENLRGFAGAIALLLREHAPGVGAVAFSRLFQPPAQFGFVTYGAIEDPAARAAALCTAYVAAGHLPPSALALEAMRSGPLPAETADVVRAAIRTSVEALSARVGAALDNLEPGHRPCPTA